MKYNDFLNDVQKLSDFLILEKREFLKFYPYITTFEYDLTTNKFYENTVLNLFNFIKKCKTGDYDTDTQFYFKIAYLKQIDKLSKAQQKDLNILLDKENLLHYN